MQVLVAAGLPYIGEVFPEPWGTNLRAANSRGFFESQLLSGIYYATNPHPVSGAFLAPSATRDHVVKVFIPGLVKTDLAYLDYAVATVRSWREFSASLSRMEELGGRGEEPVSEFQASAPLRWWIENFALIRDIATRGYRAHVTTYDRILKDPEKEVSTVLRWLGRGDRKAARAAVERRMRTQHRPTSVISDLDSSHESTFDELYELLDGGADLTPQFIQKLNETDAELRPRILEARARAQHALVTHITARELPA